MKVAGDFTAQVQIKVNSQNLYDQTA
ncbi:DUF1349 domain-containing protein [Pseudomonas syringae]|nr:DUF1349 domain-containing protein [Pseudomonas syringae]